MKAIMAPVDQVLHPSMEDLRRRHDLLHDNPLRRRDKRDAGGGGGGGNGDRNRRDVGGFLPNSNSDPNNRGSSPSNNDNSDNSDSPDKFNNWDNSDDSNDSNNNSNDGSGDNTDRNTVHSFIAPSFSSLDHPTFTSPVFMLSQSALPTTSSVVVISTTPTSALSIPSSTNTLISSLSSTNTLISSPSSTITLISSFFPTVATTTPQPTAAPSFIPVDTTLADTSSEPRKGLNTDGAESSFDFSSSSSSTTKTTANTTKATTKTTSIPIPESALASSGPSMTAAGGNVHHNNNKHDGLTPVAEHLLIAAGLIGTFIMIMAGIYFLCRMMRIDLSAKLRNRKLGRGGSRGWYGWRRQEEHYSSDTPPQYAEDIYPLDEKPIPNQQQLDAFYSPITIPSMATPATAAVLSNADSERQNVVREALLGNPAPFGTSVLPPFITLSATQNFYQTNSSNTPSPLSPLSRQASDANKTLGTQNILLSKENSDYNNTGTQNTFLTQNAYDPNQREPNHLSYLSSLSSGFGDGLIIPESTVAGGGPRQSYRQSRNQRTSRFSWATSARGPTGDRDTVYTTSSIDSAPRFRTVNSWVAQQTGRVEKRAQNQKEVPAMPAIPLPLQAGVDHQQNPIEDPAFRAHPGDEIAVSNGTRIPSVILDRNTGLN